MRRNFAADSEKRAGRVVNIKQLIRKGLVVIRTHHGQREVLSYDATTGVVKVRQPSWYYTNQFPVQLETLEAGIRTKQGAA